MFGMEKSIGLLVTNEKSKLKRAISRQTHGLEYGQL